MEFETAPGRGKAKKAVGIVALPDDLAAALEASGRRAARIARIVDRLG